MIDWRDMSTAPRDGTWILAMNNRGNCAVIIWSDSAPSDIRGRGSFPGWIHPFSDGSLSTFWNGANGSLPILWALLPTREEKSALGLDSLDERWRLTRIEMEAASKHRAPETPQKRSESA